MKLTAIMTIAMTVVTGARAKPATGDRTTLGRSIMKAHWTPDDLDNIRAQPLRRTSEDVNLILIGMASRAARGAKPTAKKWPPDNLPIGSREVVHRNFVLIPEHFEILDQMTGL
jgi:hypothetical protein